MSTPDFGVCSRETRISVSSFVGRYLPILYFPRDVCKALERVDLNLFQAHQLARLTAKRLGRTDGSLRKRLLEVYLLTHGSGTMLR